MLHTMTQPDTTSNDYVYQLHLKLQKPLENVLNDRSHKISVIYANDICIDTNVFKCLYYPINN